MTTDQTAPGLVKRTGTISNYTVKRGDASFVFTEADKTKLGVLAVAAGLAGLGGQAIATAGFAASTEEAADYVEFDLDGSPVKGWVWRSPFKEGDQVEVVGEINGSYLEVAAIARPADHIIALYPHCSRGRSRHVWNALKWWTISTAGFLGGTLFFLLVAGSPQSILNGWSEGGNYAVLGVVIFFALMFSSLTRKWMPFVRVAEKVFKALGWPNPGAVDLVKSSKAKRRPEDPGEYGTFYFRY
jgi:hypothetical protein